MTDDTVDGLATVSVAHDALLEGRAVDVDGPLWARPSRLLTARRPACLQDYLDALIERARESFGPDVSVATGTVLYQILKMNAQKLYDLQQTILATC